MKYKYMLICDYCGHTALYRYSIAKPSKCPKCGDKNISIEKIEVVDYYATEVDPPDVD